MRTQNSRRKAARRFIRWFWFTTAVGPVLFTASAVLAQTAAPAASSSSGDDAALQTVVVTARRRAENLQDVPLGISVLSGAGIQTLGQDSLSDLYLQVPSLRVVDINPRNAALTIRGIGANLANEGLVNSVGVYVDGVYYARPGAAAFGEFDIDQIEVLRGPQGTLFGKNTTAGALNITTRKPTFDPEFIVEASAGDYDYYNVAATASGPFTDTLAGRLTASLKSREGFLANVDTGQKENDSEEETLRGQLLWKPVSNFSLRAIGDYEFQRIHCCVDVISNVTTTYDDGTPIPNNFAVRSAKLGYTPLPVDPFARKTDIDSPQLIRTAQLGGSVEANWTVAGATFTSLTAFRQWRFNPENDLDFTAVPVLTQGAYDSRSHQFSQEFRVSSQLWSTIDYVAGLYYFYEPLASNTLETFGSGAGIWILPTLPSTISTPALNGLNGVGDDRAYTESFAGFGQGTWHITRALSLTGGLRYTYEKKWGYSEQVAVGGAALSTFPVALQPTIGAIRAGSVITYDTRKIAGLPQDYDEGNVSGTASLAYKLTSTINAYATYSRGYKSGGINFTVVPTGASQIINPEFDDDYELGLKSTLFSHRLVLNADLFWTNVSNYQSTQLFLNPVTGGFTSYVTNAAQLRSRGFEVDADAIIAPGLTATGSLAYTDAIYTSYKNAPCALNNSGSRCDLSGTEIPNVSRWALHGGVSYSPPIVLGQIYGEGVRPVINADVAYRTGFLGGTSIATKIPGYTVANLSIAFHLDKRGTVLTLWAHNLFNENYYTTKTPLIFNTGAVSAELGDPRTVGATLRQSF